MSQPLHFLTIVEAAALISRRELSPVEYLEALITRIESLDPQVNAFVHRMFESARAQAAAAERDIVAGNYRGPLHGIPIGLKDIIDVAGVPVAKVRSREFPDPKAG